MATTMELFEVFRDIFGFDEEWEKNVMEKGRENGIKEGKFEVARSMLARKMSVSDIVDITGLNEKDVLAL